MTQFGEIVGKPRTVFVAPLPETIQNYTISRPAGRLAPSGRRQRRRSSTS
jgi:hypothetical protein